MILKTYEKTDNMKTVYEINKKIAADEAVIMTAVEFKSKIEDNLNIDDVDVVTTGTFGVMSGTMAVMTIPVSKKNSFEKADKVWLNGVPATPGPCPNEKLGVVDIVINATAYADDKYGGGHLFRDIVKGEEIEIQVEAQKHNFHNTVTLKDMTHARLITTRSAFRNYQAFINPTSSIIPSIFSVTGLKGQNSETTVSGCGEINPLQNDMFNQVIGIGTKILVNGALGYIIGTGTRSSLEKPNLSTYADMKKMNYKLMGGMKTSKGPECLTSIAIPIPVINEKVWDSLKITDADIPLPIVDINGREICGYSDYAHVWKNTIETITSKPDKCINHYKCSAMEMCPTDAIYNRFHINKDLCINCGTCTHLCSEGVFKGNLGFLKLNDKNVPISLRQSDRSKAEKLCIQLKNDILNHKFTITERLESL